MREKTQKARRYVVLFESDTTAIVDMTIVAEDISQARALATIKIKEVYNKPGNVFHIKKVEELPSSIS